MMFVGKETTCASVLGCASYVRLHTPRFILVDRNYFHSMFRPEFKDLQRIISVE